MDTAFGILVKRRLTDLGMSQREFAALVGLSHANINKIINASHEAPPPPLGADLMRWASVLQIPTDQQQYFCDLAALVYLPHAVRPQWEAWYEQYQVTLAQQVNEQQPLSKPLRAAENTPPYDTP
jgi:transcriptional regulator with XRE-family HTH domain